MSNEFRKSILNRLPRLPPTRAPWADETPAGGDDEEEVEELQGGDTMGELGTALPASSSSSSKRLQQQDLSPLSASTYFSQALEVDPSGNDTTFRVYITPPSQAPQAGQGEGKGKGKDTYLVCHHGAGASALSFAPLAKRVTETSAGELGILAYDCRGHGKTRSQGGKDRDIDLSLPTLLADFLGLITHLYPDPGDAPSLLLCGHSMGAAPILSAAPILQQKGYTVPGLIVLDVVEGTAVEALPIMKSILAGRPTAFRSVVDGIHWHITSNSIRNAESARVSVPSILIPQPDVTDPGPQSAQTWRTDLLATEPFWQEWYAGLSARFLGTKCARLLVLAGDERLDKDLMVGQMQGKFQLEVMQGVGHYLHEDDPETLASTIVTFWRRNTRVLVLPPKIGAPAAGSSTGGTEVKRVGEH